MPTRPSPGTAPNILVPWDGVTPLAQVLTFARTIGGQDATLMLLPLAPGLIAGDAIAADSPASWSAQEGAFAPIEELTLPHLPADLVLGISAIAAERAVDLILMATPCHPAGELDPSCLAAQLALDSPIPVTVVHFSCDDVIAFPPPLKRLLVPLDGSLRAAQALPVAASLAGRLRLPVRFVMVIDPARVLPPAFAYDPAAAELITGLKQDAHWALTQAEQLLGHQGLTVSSDIHYGPVVGCLEAAIAPGDVLVMTTHGTGGAPRSRLGSVAARLVADVPAPLVIMRSSPPAEVVAGVHSETTRYTPLSRPTA